MPTDQRPPFPTYLLPSFSFPFRRRSHDRERQHSASTISTYASVPSLSSSPNSSANTTPSSSPTSTYSIPHPLASAKAFLQAALRNEPEPQPRTTHTEENERDTRLTRTAPNTLKCITCATDIAFASQIVSKGFTGRHGRAYLVAPPPTLHTPLSSRLKSKRATDLINTKTGRAVNRELLTGAHVVADVSCTICTTVLGWKYVDAKESAQRYKIGKFILEMKRVVLGVAWEDDVPREDGEGEGVEKEWNAQAEEGEDGVIVFDEEDEEECEDLFGGVWDPEVVAKRRSRRVGARRKIEV